MKITDKNLFLFLMFFFITACSSMDEQSWKSYEIATPIFDMVFDQDGKLWVVGYDGALKLDPRNGDQVEYSENDGLASNRIYEVALSTDNSLWFGTQNGLSNFNREKWQNYQEGYTIPSVFAASDGSLWMGVRQELEGCHNCGWVSLFSGQNWNNYNPIDGCAPSSITEDRNGIMWFGTPCGLVSFDGKEWKQHTIPGNSQQNNIVDLLVASDDTVWVGSAQNVHQFDGEKWKTFTINNGLPCNRINSIAEDGSGGIWIGTCDGAARYDGMVWTIYTTEDGLIDNSVITIVIEPNDTIWFGTEKGISRYWSGD